MSKKQQRYFNFPIILLDGFMTNDTQVFNNIYNYSIFVQSISYAEKEGFDLTVNEDIEKAVDLSDLYFGVKTGDKEKVFNNGKYLFDRISNKAPKAGINKDVFFEYYFNEKSDFEKACLLAFLALKSIITNKTYCKVTNAYLWSRMDGKSKSITQIDELSEDIKQFANRYQIEKFKNELVLNWNLVYYSRYTRGFYVSFKLKLNDLVFEAEKKRKSIKIKQQKLLQNEALEKALKRLESK